MKTIETRTPLKEREKRQQYSSVPRLTRQLAGIMAHLEQHPNDALSKARVAKIQEILREA